MSYPRTLTVDGAELYLEHHGSGEPLLCLHSFASNGRARFGPLLPWLAERHECVVLDLRGHGRSTNASGVWTHEQVAQDIIAVLESLGTGPVPVLAASSGAMAMLRVARMRPDLVRSLVLDSGTYQIPEQSRDQYRHPDELSPKIKKIYTEANEVYGPEYGAVLAQTFYDFRLPTCDINQPLEHLAMIQAPTLLLSGDTDQFFPPFVHEAIARTIPNAEWVRFPETGHIVMHFYPERVATLALEFFARTKPHAGI